MALKLKSLVCLCSKSIDRALETKLGVKICDKFVLSVVTITHCITYYKFTQSSVGHILHTKYQETHLYIPVYHANSQHHQRIIIFHNYHSPSTNRISIQSSSDNPFMFLKSKQCAIQKKWLEILKRVSFQRNPFQSRDQCSQYIDTLFLFL